MRVVKTLLDDVKNEKAVLSYQVASDYWLGNNWMDYDNRVQSNIKRAEDFLNDKAWSSSYVTLTCADPQQKCKKQMKGKKGLTIGGYAWDYNGWFGTYGYINFCSPYFTTKQMHQLVDFLDDFRENNDRANLQEMANYRGSARFMLHEMMHLKSTSGPEPHIEDIYIGEGNGQDPKDMKAYGPKWAYWLAHGQKGTGDTTHHGAGRSTINADSYALLINALYWWGSGFTKHFPGYSRKESPDDENFVVMPHLPVNDSAGFSIDSINDQMNKLIDSYDTDSSDDSDEPSKPAESEAPAPDVNSCHGLGGDYWVMSRDTAAQNVEDFCSQSEHTKKYNEGSVNELELFVKKVDDDGKSPQDSPDCAGRFMRAVIDGCDSGDMINNPHNYKFGSALTTGDGWSYTMTPLSKQVKGVNCDVAYKVFFDGFEIRGKNWPFAKFGENGEGLRDEIAGCGAITSWDFDWTPDDCCFQLYARGRLPIGTKACVGWAIESAGNSGKDNCHGAGKRAPVSKDATNNWPGYGDEGRHVFGQTKHTKKDSIDSWPDYGDEGRHVFSNDDTVT